MNNHNLELKVRAVNNCHARVNEFMPKLKAFFRPYVGFKILKADGSFLKSVESDFNKSFVFPRGGDFHGFHVCRSFGYSLCWEFTWLEFSPVQGHEQHKHTLYIGEMETVDGSFSGAKSTLKSLYANNDEPLRTDFTVQEILRIRASIKKAKETYENMKSMIYPFSED